MSGVCDLKPDTRAMGSAVADGCWHGRGTGAILSYCLMVSFGSLKGSIVSKIISFVSLIVSFDT